MECIVAVDPGRQKCGVAVLSTGGEVLARRVVARHELTSLLRRWLLEFSPAALVLGDRTGSAQFVDEIKAAGLDRKLEVYLVDEHLSTLEARRRYFAERPPRGLRRLIPLSMQVPPEPYDDWVAVILGERYLQGRRR